MNDLRGNHWNAAAPLAALILLLTAWGNAIGMAIVSGMILTGLFVFGRGRLPNAAVVSVGCLVAFAVAFFVATLM